MVFSSNWKLQLDMRSVRGNRQNFSTRNSQLTIKGGKRVNCMACTTPLNTHIPQEFGDLTRKSKPFHGIGNFCSLNAVEMFIMRFALKVWQRFSHGRMRATSNFRKCENRVSTKMKGDFLLKRRQSYKDTHHTYRGNEREGEMIRLCTVLLF